MAEMVRGSVLFPGTDRILTWTSLLCHLCVGICVSFWFHPSLRSSTASKWKQKIEINDGHFDFSGGSGMIAHVPAKTTPGCVVSGFFWGFFFLICIDLLTTDIVAE